MRPDHLETAFGMNADRAGIGGIPDHGDHLPVAARLALGNQPLSACSAGDANQDGAIAIDDLIRAVNTVLQQPQ